MEALPQCGCEVVTQLMRENQALRAVLKQAVHRLRRLHEGERLALLSVAADLETACTRCVHSSPKTGNRKDPSSSNGCDSTSGSPKRPS
jgi:hypothetical protein